MAWNQEAGRVMPLLEYWKFCRSLYCQDEMPRLPLRDRGAAHDWVQRWKSDSFRMSEMRALLAQDRLSRDVSRVSDDTVLDQIAALLAAGLLHVHIARTPTAVGASASLSQSERTAVEPEISVPFPLSNRNRRAPRAQSSKTIPPPADPPSFPPDTDFGAQLAQLIAAAKAGLPAYYI